jgi:phosphate/sulfate permease
MSYLGQLVALSAVVMGIAQTLTKERMFEPLRQRLGGQETWLGYLVSCPYCTSHWVAFVLVPLTGVYGIRVQVRWGVLTTLLDWFLSSILVVVIAAFLRVAFWFVDESQGLVRRRNKVIEQVAQEGDDTHVRH